MRLYSSASLAVLLGLGALSMAAPTAVEAQVMIGVSVGFAPPMLPIYYQPRIPAYGYIWTPGFWAWDRGSQDYYWVPGTWVRPPRVGLLWTPGYWGWQGGSYLFNDGYWGSSVGYYGGINYGYGYGGHGYDGGEWRGGRLYYNRTVNNVSNLRGTTFYSRAVTGGSGRVSFNGGTGGVQMRPDAAQMANVHSGRVNATVAQQHHFAAARAVPSLRSKVNHGTPAILATARPGVMRAAATTGAARTAVTHQRPAASARPPQGHAVQSGAVQHGGGDAASRTGSARPAVERRAAPQADRAGGGRPAAPSRQSSQGGQQMRGGNSGGGQQGGERQGGGQPTQRQSGGSPMRGGNPGGGGQGGGRPGGGAQQDGGGQGGERQGGGQGKDHHPNS